MEIQGREEVLKTAIEKWKQSKKEDYSENTIAYMYESIGMQKALAILENKSYQQIAKEFAEILNL